MCNIIVVKQLKNISLSFIFRCEMSIELILTLAEGVLVNKGSRAQEL